MSPASTNYTPEFRILQEDDPQIAFIIDIETKTNRKKAIIRALGRFAQALEPQSTLTVLDIKDSRKVHRSNQSPGVVWSKKDDFKSLIWGKSTSTPICLRCVFDILEKSFGSEDDSSHLVVITEGKLTDSNIDLDHIASSVNRRNMPFKIAIFPYIQEDERNGHYDGIKYLVSKINGSSIHLISSSSSQLNAFAHASVFTVDSIYPGSSSAPKYASSSNVVGASSATAASDESDSATMYSKLCDVFDSIFPNRQHMLISRQLFYPSTTHSLDETGKDIQFSFNVDNSLLNSSIDLVAQFISSNQNEEFDGPTYHLEGWKENAVYDTKSTEYTQSTFSTPYFQVPLGFAGSGKWTLKHTRQNVNSTFVGVAYAKISSRRRHPITAKCIISNYEPEEFIPPVLNVFLSRDQTHLVQNASVTVTLTDDLGEPLPEAQNLPLFDDGLTTPDITQGDGIYSRYLPETSRGGFYGVQVKIRSGNSTLLHKGSSDAKGVECCGSSVPKTNRNLEQVLDLERTVDCGYIYVKVPFNAAEFTERITDLQIDSVDTINRKVKVIWTVPSLDFDRMELKVFRYNEWRMINQHDFDSYGTTVIRLTNPTDHIRSHGEREKHVHSFNVTDSNEGIYYVAIRVQTTSRSFISNIATYYMTSDPASSTPPSE